jgi:hypothetical protein
MPSADFCLLTQDVAIQGAAGVPHEALSVSWFHEGLLSVNSKRIGRVLGLPVEPSPDSTHKFPVAW